MNTDGQHMAREMQEAAGVFARAVRQPVAVQPVPSAIYTFARGSSDTAANVLSYAYMQALGIPVTSLPPSVFSLGQGVHLNDALSLIISQSGASADLVACAKGADRSVAITNVEGSAVEAEVSQTLRIAAGPEYAIPATKTVVGALGAGLALLAAMKPDLQGECLRAAEAFKSPLPALEALPTLVSALSKADHIYILGRRASYGVAQEVALKLKETCALHAEAYSASEVLHGPLQLSTRPLTVLVLDPLIKKFKILLCVLRIDEMYI